MTQRHRTLKIDIRGASCASLCSLLLAVVLLGAGCEREPAEVRSRDTSPELHFWLTREQGRLGPSFQIEMEIGASDRVPLKFDAVRLDYSSAAAEDDPMKLTGQTLLFTDDGLVSLSEWAGTMLTPEGTNLSPIAVPADKAVLFKFSVTSTPLKSVPTVARVRLLLGGRPVSPTYAARLPSIEVVPDASGISGRREGHHVSPVRLEPSGR